MTFECLLKVACMSFLHHKGFIFSMCYVSIRILWDYVNILLVVRLCPQILAFIDDPFLIRLLLWVCRMVILLVHPSPSVLTVTSYTISCVLVLTSAMNSWLCALTCWLATAVIIYFLAVSPLHSFIHNSSGWALCPFTRALPFLSAVLIFCHVLFLPRTESTGFPAPLPGTVM